jgi:hypothetical protein
VRLMVHNPSDPDSNISTEKNKSTGMPFFENLILRIIAVSL